MTRTARRRWLAVAATVVVVLPLAWFWQASLVPDTYDMAAMGHPDWGGGRASTHAGHSGTAVADLDSDQRDGTAGQVPDLVETLTVRREGDRYTVNGSTPGPLLRATLGDLVEVTLVNENVEDGTTLHWHGLDVPNAMDGVAGVTQDAVMPGERFTYRFLADQAGTYWYHSHQVSHVQVLRGLLGALVIDPAKPGAGSQADIDEVAVLHQYGARSTLNGAEGTTTVAAQPGEQARVRVVNTDNGVATAWVRGAAYEVLAVDGVDLNEPDPVDGLAIAVPAGGRVDLGITVPEAGARVDFGGTTALVLGRDPTGGDAGTAPTRLVDLLDYGSPAPLPFDPAEADRRFTYEIDRRPGFLDGRPGLWWTINGGIFPDVPMYMVEEGDVAIFRIVNSSGDAHPMHLHGHHAVVLSRDGVPATGSPWWVDSLEVAVGESFEIAFVADNPGLWMDHCHNLPHAVEGLVSHLMYAGVSSSFRVGTERHNEPE